MTLSELEKLCEAATPGPWDFDGGGDYVFASPADGSCPVAEMRGFGSGLPMEANAAFIAASRTMLPKLLKVARAAKAEEDAAAEAKRVAYAPEESCAEGAARVKAILRRGLDARDEKLKALAELEAEG